MEYIPIKTSVMQPPKADLFAVLDQHLTDVQENDVILITSKIVAIHQGRCVPSETTTKRELAEVEADYFDKNYESYARMPLVIKHHVLFYGAGIDESNADGHYILLPEKPFDAAEEIWMYLKKKHNVENIGVIITDSHTQPMRIGAVGVSIAWWGFHPVESHRGKKDLFGKPLQFSTTNIVDCIAAGSNAVSGETDECTPIITVRGLSRIQFTKVDTRHEVFKEQKSDIYYHLLKQLYE